jgi:hypothetical protein
MSLRDAPIRRKLMRIMLLTSGLVLLLTCAAFLSYELLTFRQTAVRELSTVGRLIAANSTASLAFQNPDDEREVMAALKAEPNIVAAALYDADGRLFAVYPEDLAAEVVPAVPQRDGFRFAAAHLAGYEPVVEDGRRLGTLYLRAGMGAKYDRLQLYAGIAAGGDRRLPRGPGRRGPLRRGDHRPGHAVRGRAACRARGEGDVSHHARHHAHGMGPADGRRRGPSRPRGSGPQQATETAGAQRGAGRVLPARSSQGVAMISSPCRWITLVGLLLSSPAVAAAQVEASAAPPRTTVWIGGGYGRGWAQGLRTEEAFSLNVSGQRGSVMLSTRVAAVSESVDETNWDIGLLGGIASSPRYPVHGGAAIGLGYAESEPGEGAVTVPAEVQFFWRFSRFAGGGLYAFASLNTNTFAGATLALQMGRLR